MANYATNIALVKDEVVENVIWGMFYSADAYALEGYIAIPIGDLNVNIGDTFVNGRFYNQDGELVKRIRETYEDEIAELDNYILEFELNQIINNNEEEE